jgi:phage shock protein A
VARFSSFVRRAARLPGVPQARHVTERAVAPYLRADLHSLHSDLVDALERIGRIEQRLDAIDEHMPAVLNAIVSTKGNARLTQREMTALRAEIAELRAATAALDAAVEPPVAEHA